jgi:hypothetical protein
MTRISEHFDLALSQPQLDFVDTKIESDTRVFIDPRALTTLDTEWGHECVALVGDFFGCVLAAITSGDEARAVRLLNQLHEPNETRLGLSRGTPAGHALGPELAGRVRLALERSEAVKSGLLTDLEDTILMIEGISSDLISDITTNVIREPLIRYTQQACDDLAIPMEENIYPGGPLWDPGTEDWYQSFVTLPLVGRKPLLLVPKVIVRMKMDYDADEYYDNYIIPLLRELAIEANSDLVKIIKKTNEPHVTKKDLVARYGRGKTINEQMTRAHPQLIDSYRKNKTRHVHAPISHGDLAGLTGTQPPDFDALLSAVTTVKPGKAEAGRYQRAAMNLLTPLFYPWLSMPQYEDKINNGRKRIDITYVNAATAGFFDWLARRYNAPYVFVECKNYTEDPANPELDQLAGRFSPRRGDFGLLVCRRIADKDLFAARCRDLADADRGYTIGLDDADLAALVKARQEHDTPGAITMLLKRFHRLVKQAPA